jgi:hypothetical protein
MCRSNRSLIAKIECTYAKHSSINNASAAHVKTHKLLQICKQVVTNLFTSCQQVVFALLVPSCCNKFETSC